MILDTSVLIEVLGNNAALEEKLEKMDGGERMATTTVTKYELLKGPKEGGVLALLNTIEIYDYDSRAAERSAKIFKELKRKGRMVNELDILIASIAIAHDELLVTRDNDFKRIEHLKVLVL